MGDQHSLFDKCLSNPRHRNYPSQYNAFKDDSHQQAYIHFLLLVYSPKCLCDDMLGPHLNSVQKRLRLLLEIGFLFYIIGQYMHRGKYFDCLSLLGSTYGPNKILNERRLLAGIG